MSQHGCPERLSNRPKGFEDGTSQPTMEVLVETLTGTAFEMTVSPSDTIFAIKSKIFRVEGIPVSQQHLLYNLKELDDASSLRELAIADGARLKLVLGLRGGPISTRRLPPPPAADAPWRDIERLLDSSRDDASWTGGGAAPGCKVTVLVFRDGERYNMLRVRENDDGSYSPIDQKSECASLRPLLSPREGRSAAGAGAAGGAGCGAENALTMGKMLDLRRRMEAMQLQRRARPSGSHSPAEPIQKTRSEETLAAPRLLDADGAAQPARCRRYELGGGERFELGSERYALLPRIGARADEDLSVHDDDRWGLALPEGLPSLLFADDEDALCLAPDGQLAPLPRAEYGPLVVRGGAWRVRGFGSSSQLAAPGGPRAPRRAPLAPLAPLADTLLSSSTSDLERLARPRLLPALSRHRNREHLHLSDEGLDRPRGRGAELPAPPAPPRPRNLEVGSERRQHRINKIAERELASTRSLFEEASPPAPAPPPPPPPAPEAKKLSRARCGLCRKRLNIATQHTCRCGGRFCAPHRYAEAHGCAHDYKANAHRFLQRDNPRVQAPKLPKI